MLNYQTCVFMPYLYTHPVVKMVPFFKMAAKISQFTIKRLINEVNILDTSMKCNGVIDTCVELSNLCCMPYLNTHPVVKMAVIFQNGHQNLTVHN